MCNKLLAFIKNLWIPSVIKKEIEELHEHTIRLLWNNIYHKIDIIGETGTSEEMIIRFPLNRTYEIDGYWKTYNYDLLDFGFYTIKLDNTMEYLYKEIPIILDFYSDGSIGFLEIARK